MISEKRVKMQSVAITGWSDVWPWARGAQHASFARSTPAVMVRGTCLRNARRRQKSQGEILLADSPIDPLGMLWLDRNLISLANVTLYASLRYVMTYSCASRSNWSIEDLWLAVGRGQSAFLSVSYLTASDRVISPLRQVDEFALVISSSSRDAYGIIDIWEWLYRNAKISLVVLESAIDCSSDVLHNSTSQQCISVQAWGFYLPHLLLSSLKTRKD